MNFLVWNIDTGRLEKVSQTLINESQDFVGPYKPFLFTIKLLQKF